jgi:hypothetical protein
MSSSSALNSNEKTPTATPIESISFTDAIILNKYMYEIRILELVGRRLRNQYKSMRSDARMQDVSVRYEVGRKRN